MESASEAEDRTESSGLSKMGYGTKPQSMPKMKGPSMMKVKRPRSPRMPRMGKGRGR